MVGLLAYVVGWVALKGVSHITVQLFTKDQAHFQPSDPNVLHEVGILHAIVGSVEQVGIAAAFAVPVAVITAVFLNEVRGPGSRIVRTIVTAMAGVPSVVAGVFIYSSLILTHVMNFSGFAASLALFILILPWVTRTTEEVLRLVPGGLREASLALGAPEWRTVWSVVLPTARSGIITAVLLGVAIAIGETAPLLFTAFGSSVMNVNPLHGDQGALPITVYANVRQAQAVLLDLAYATAFVLLSIVLILFVLRPRSRAPAHHQVTDAATAAHGRVAANQTRSGPAMTLLADKPDTTPGPPPGPPPATRACELVATGVCAWFGPRLVLENVNLTFPRTTVSALIGPSGCGKSTFLRILNRMHELVPGAKLAGSVELEGTDIYSGRLRATDTRRDIGMVFQKPNPFPAMSIADNVLSGLRFSRIKTSSRKDLIEESLSKAGLWNEVKDRLDSLGGALSGGQQQRLCIARALAVKPKVLLMDEPCSALDPSSTRRIEQTIGEIAHEVTIVIVTHNMQQALRVSRRARSSWPRRTNPAGWWRRDPPRPSSTTPVTRGRRTMSTAASVSPTRQHRLGRLSARAVLVATAIIGSLGLVEWQGAAPAWAGYPTLQSTGSSFAGVAIQQWVGQASTLYGLNINWVAAVVGHRAQRVRPGLGRLRGLGHPLQLRSGPEHSDIPLRVHARRGRRPGLHVQPDRQRRQPDHQCRAQPGGHRRHLLRPHHQMERPGHRPLNPQLAGDLPSTTIVPVFREDALGRELPAVGLPCCPTDSSTFTAAGHGGGVRGGNPGAQWPTPPGGRRPVGPSNSNLIGQSGSDNAANYVSASSRTEPSPTWRRPTPRAQRAGRLRGQRQRQRRAAVRVGRRGALDARPASADLSRTDRRVPTPPTPTPSRPTAT